MTGKSFGRIDLRGVKEFLYELVVSLYLFLRWLVGLHVLLLEEPRCQQCSELATRQCAVAIVL